MKFIRNSITTLALTLSLGAFAQQTTSKPIKIDGVAAVIGENIVLESDITKFKEELQTRSEGNLEVTECEMLEDIMMQKLMAHQAVQDSIVVTESEVLGEVEQNIAYLSSQLNGIEKVIEFYGFNNENDLRDELIKIQKETTLVKREQASIVENIHVTPEEVRLYYKSLEEKNSLPEFSSEVEISQIVLNIEPSVAEVNATINQLNKIRQEVIDGASMRMRAIMYSDDPSVTQNGGMFELERNSQFVKEFKEVAFSLDKGEVSEPFKSPFGYHILIVEDVKGQKVVVRHILIQPEVSEEALRKSKEKLQQIRTEIILDKITFEEAVAEYSQDKNTRLSKGVLMNRMTQDSRFDLTRMDPSLYARISNLKQGEMSDVYYDETREGEKMYKILLMKNLIPAHQADLKKDYVKIQKLALQKKQQEEIEKWAAKKIADTYIKIGEDYKDCNFENNWLKNKD